MGTNLKRTQYKPREVILSAANSNTQTMQSLDHLRVGDRVDFIDVDTNNNIIGGAPLASNLTILAINPGTKKIVLDAAIDTTGLTGTGMLRVDNIDDGQSAIERLYRSPTQKPLPFDLRQNITRADVDKPIVGQATYWVDDVTLWRAGDDAKIIDDTGVIITSCSIVSVTPSADASNNKAKIVVDDNTALNIGNNPYIQNETIDLTKAILRNQERIDEIDRPSVNKDLTPAIGNGADTCFEFPDLFVPGTTQQYIDRGRYKYGSAGTRATQSIGTGNAQLDFTSMILGTLGNEVEVEVVAGAGLTVQVIRDFKRTGANDYSNSQYLVRVNDNGGAATSKDIADAINANADARRIVQAIYGGDGSGVVAPFAATNLAGGLDDGDGDYAELEQVFENKITATGFKFISFHIRSDERNKMDEPPQDDENVWADYSTAADNVDR